MSATATPQSKSYSTGPQLSEKGRAALRYAAQGRRIVPLTWIMDGHCSCSKHDCTSPGKHPLTSNGLKDASCIRDKICEWWTRWPDANIGLLTGLGLVVLDVDGPQGAQSLAELESRYGKLPETTRVTTGKGFHFYLKVPIGRTIRNSQGKIAPGIDVRGDGGYVVGPESVHISGALYTTSDPDLKSASLPDAWVSLLESSPASQVKPSTAENGGAVASEPIGKGDRTKTLTQQIGFWVHKGYSQETIRSMAHGLNSSFTPPLPDKKVNDTVADEYKRFSEKDRLSAVQTLLEDPRPKVRLRGDNRLLSDVASELGPYLSNTLYVHNGEVVEYRDGAIHAVSAQQFRTLAEKHVVFYRVRSANESTVQVGTTLDESEARGILASPQFRECLRPLRHVNTVRLPVIRSDGRIELLPTGYDTETATLTDAQVDYSENMAFADAVETVRDLYGEFQFADGDRSLAVAVSALVGLHAAQIVPDGELRPAFTYLKNAEGAGGYHVRGMRHSSRLWRSPDSRKGQRR